MTNSNIELKSHKHSAIQLIFFAKSLNRLNSLQYYNRVNLRLFLLNTYVTTYKFNLFIEIIDNKKPRNSKRITRLAIALLSNQNAIRSDATYLITPKASY